MEHSGKKLIFPTFLAPPLAYYQAIYHADEVIIDLHETYVKQSLRNRYFISFPNGIQRLVIPVIKAAGHRTKTHEVKIDYKVPWIPHHIRSLETAYNKTPYFLYVKDELFRCFEKRHIYLWQLNADINALIWKWLDIKTPIIYSQEFIPFDEKKPNDFRLLMKKDQMRPAGKKYYQPFAEKYGFVDGLSILDAIFCAGLEVKKWFRGF